MVAASSGKYHRRVRRVNGKVTQAIGTTHLDHWDPLKRSKPKSDEALRADLYDAEWLETPECVQLKLLAEYVKLVESRQDAKNKTESIVVSTSASLESDTKPAVDLDLVAKRLKEDEQVNHRNRLISGLMFAGSAGLLVAASATSLDSVKSLATGYAIATATTALSAKRVDDSTEEKR